jgi:hypothetical protein
VGRHNRLVCTFATETSSKKLPRKGLAWFRKHIGIGGQIHHGATYDNYY